MVRRWFILLWLVMVVGNSSAAERTYVDLPGGEFSSALKYEDSGSGVRIAPFSLMKLPVTNADFLVFVRRHPQWRRDRVAGVFAESRYLSHWAGPTQLGPQALPRQPVVWVSWFAADAYCQAQGARLPTWSQWEYAAAADEQRADARGDRAWRERMLSWYAQPSNHALPAVGSRLPNAYGVHDLHGLVWEWADDFSALLVSSDNRDQGDPDRLKFCGAGALSVNDRDHYAVLMRVAMLSSLEGAYATANLGFRCAR
ncbi:MAG: formylglycine-generating enzyme family protein [Burkholderiaceae bacterium]|nr:formylglycine-generating enzyme family protein [Burkholderiaceae bacterium]